MDQRQRADVTWRTPAAAALAVDAVARVAAEQPAFTYRDGRDITGFIDGTANPPVRRAAEVALVPPGLPGAGGSHVLAMRWVHDLDAFERLPVEEQQRRDRANQARQRRADEAVRPPTAHIARVEITVDGAELQIFRRSVPYGTVAGARPVLRRLQRRRARATTGCSLACSGPRATGSTTT